MIRREPMGPALSALLSPVALGALVLLLVNDHLLKPTLAGWLTGKLSGIAGLALTPFVLFALLELAITARPGLPRPGWRAAAVLVAATASAYAAVELVPAAGEAYRWTWGALQLPYGTVADLLTGRGLTSIVPVSATADPSDLLALPASLAILIVLSRDKLQGRGRLRRTPLGTAGDMADPKRDGRTSLTGRISCSILVCEWFRKAHRSTFSRRRTPRPSSASPSDVSTT